MAVADTRELYPLATPGGEAIPYDVFRANSFLRVSITTVVSGSITIPTSADFLIMFCDVPCIVRFNAVASIPASGVELLSAFALPANTIWTIDHNAALSLTAIGVSATAGVLYINTVKKWKDVHKASLANRM